MSVRHFTDLSAVSAGDLRIMLDDAVARKTRLKAGERSKPLDGKVLAMIFDKPSTRTRVSFDVGMRQLGGESIMLTAQEMQLGRGETLAATARVLSRFVDAIMIRILAHEAIAELARHATVPVISGGARRARPGRGGAGGGAGGGGRGPGRGRAGAGAGGAGN